VSDDRNSHRLALIVVISQPVEDRIDQARKVQQVGSNLLRGMANECNHFIQLLAALKQPQGTAPGAPQTQVQPQPSAPAPQLSQLSQNPFYPPASTVQQPVQQPPPIYTGAAPPTAPGFPSLSQTSLPQGGPAAPAPANPLANLPPNILALLQGVQAQQQPSSTPQQPQSTTPIPGPYGTVPPGQMRPSMPPHLAGPPPPTVPMQSGLGGEYPGQMMNYFVSSITSPVEICV
jgi:hypothetical protein